MRGLNRNKRLIHYARRLGEVANTDDNGYETGEISPIYGMAEPLWCNVSPSIGEDAVRVFGNMTGYSRTIYVAESKCPMDENCIVWFGIPTTDPHNYIVVGRADSINGVLYAIREVTVE